MLVDQLTDMDNLFAGRPTRAAWRAFARSLLDPIFARVAWPGAPGRAADAGDAATLPVDLIVALGTFDDEAVVAEVERRFERFLAEPTSLRGDAREAVLTVVAVRAGARDWDALHALAQEAPTELEKGRLYELLGYAKDDVQARRALELAVSGEPPATIAGRMMRSIGIVHPAMTLDFVSAHWPSVEPLFGEGAGATIAARFFDTGAERSMLPRLDAFVAAHVPAATRGRIVKNAALIRYRAGVRELRVPQAEQWLAAQPATR